MLMPLAAWRKVDAERQVLMKSALERIVNAYGISNDVYEVASKSLA
jgi:aminopeptidase N